MRTKVNGKTNLRLARGVSWASAAFYALVAFEFFYMLSPFAGYLYAAYGPGLDWLAGNSTAGWLISFFLPHLVEDTTSPLIDASGPIGAVLFAGGMIGFITGAVQIYASKLRRRGTVQGGIYTWIRHPQYLALMVASFGMMLIWPRLLVLFGFVTVVFVYSALARFEESICTRQFPDYATYQGRTGMFLPRVMEAPLRAIPVPRRRSLRMGLFVLAYFATLCFAGVVGRWVQAWSVNSLYAYYTTDSAYISIGPMSEGRIAELAGLALREPRVTEVLAEQGEGAHFLNYVLPTEMYISEVPMYLPEGASFGHTFPEDHAPGQYKIVFTRPEFVRGERPSVNDIVKLAINKAPIIEAWIDHKSGRVVEVFPPPVDPVYDGLPVPIY